MFTRNLTISVRKRINIFPVVRPLFVPGVNDADVVVPRRSQATVIVVTTDASNLVVVM